MVGLFSFTAFVLPEDFLEGHSFVNHSENLKNVAGHIDVVFVYPRSFDGAEVFLVLGLYLFEHCRLHVAEEVLELLSEIAEILAEEVGLLDLDFVLEVFLLLQEVAVDGEVDDGLEGFVGFRGLDHDASEGVAVRVVAEQTERPFLAVGVQADSFYFVVVLLACFVHFFSKIY